jgi:hypothetical protein
MANGPGVLLGDEQAADDPNDVYSATLTFTDVAYGELLARAGGKGGFFLFLAART